MPDPLKVIEDTQVTTKKTYQGVVEPEALREFLGLPSTARIFVEVPRGGDYSGCNLDIGVDAPLRVYWETVTESAGE